MRRWLAVVFCLGIPLTTYAAEPTPAPVPVEQAVSKMVLPEGFQATLFAGEPDVVQPIAMTFDERGRVWVVECVTYPNWTAEGVGHDRVTIFEDLDNDGVHDKRTVFFDNGVNLSGIEIGDGGIWLTSLPHLIFIPDKDGDDQPDGPPEVHLEGFSINAKHNVVNGLIWGPDNWLYGCNGILTTSYIGRPGTPEKERTPINCGVWRYHPERKEFEVVASGSTNPWGLDFDEFGQAMITNCVIKHLFHVVPGAHYERMFGQDLNPFAYHLLPSCADHIHWGGGHWTTSREGTGIHDDPGGGHAHSGCAVYLGDNFPAEYRNNVFMCNIHGNRLNRDLLEWDGATFSAHHAPDFLKANDPWFRGLVVKCGPEGGLYVTDWTDTGECHNYEVADTTNGRIYRVTHGTNPSRLGDLSKLSDRELVSLQFHQNDWVVRQSRRLLGQRAKEGSVAQPLAKLVGELKPKNDQEAVRKLWALNAIGESTLVGPDASEWEKVWSIQLAADAKDAWTAETKASIAAHLNDSTPLIRRALATTCQRRIRVGHADDCVNILKAVLANKNDAENEFLASIDWYAVEPLIDSHPEVVVSWLPQIAIPMVREFIGRKLATIEGGFDLLAQQWRTTTDGDWQADTLQGVLSAYAGLESRPMPEMWSQTLASLRKHPANEVRHQANVLGTLFGDEQAFAEFRGAVRNDVLPVEERIAAMDVLLARRDATVGKTLRDWLGQDPLRTSAIRGLVSIGGEDVPSLLLREYGEATPNQRQEIIHGLTTRPADAHALVNAIESGGVPRADVSALVIRQLQSLKEESLNKRLREVWGELRPASAMKQQWMEQYRNELTSDALAKADLAAGRKIYAKTCGQCHKLFGEGGAIGPELTGAQRTNLDYLLDNILDPSGIVPSDYRVVILALDDGRILQGIVAAENTLHVVLQTATERVTIPLNRIEDRRNSNVSMMPEGILNTLSEQERRDLIGYLQSQGNDGGGHVSHSHDDPWHLLDFPWESSEIHGESVTLLQSGEGDPLVGRLAFPVEQILSIQSSDRRHDLSHIEGLAVDHETGVFQLPANSPAPRVVETELYRPIDSPMSYKHRVGNPEQALLYGPHRWFHEHQVEVTYRARKDSWTGARPAPAEDLLPRTFAKLRSGEPLTIGLSGDSISTGADASGLNDIEPRQPGYPDLLSQQLREVYPGPITLKNRAVGGWSIRHGLADLDALLAEKPDLIIVAYGMNDVGRRDPKWFHDQTKELIDRVHAADPSIEILLVSSMLGNKEWIHTPREMFGAYRDELAKFVGPGVALADVTAVWEEFLKRKHDLDLTGNGLNHPNDFGHRLYAQTLLAMLMAK